MPRIRTIKPEFWTDGSMLGISRDARLFYIGLWNFADDNGVLELDLVGIKAKIFPVDKLNIQKLLDELAKINKIVIYTVEGKQYICVKNLKNHQVIDRKRHSNLPPPNENQMKSIEIIEISPRKGGEGKGKEGKGKEGKGDLVAPSDATTSPVQEFAEFFGREWSRQVGQGSPYPHNYGKERKLIKGLLTLYSLADMKLLAQKFFASDDKWLKDKGYSIGIFATQIPKLLAVKKGGLEEVLEFAEQVKVARESQNAGR